MPRSLGRPILTATLVAGTLDIIAATLITLFYGREPGNMLRYVASGPVPPATEWGAVGAVLGLVVHFSIMAAMVAAFVAAAERLPPLRRSPLGWGIVYGLVTYGVMNLVVVPLRFSGTFPPSLRSIVTQLFCHVVLVGIPIALIAARHFRERGRLA